jgi:hypothetical protein
VSIHICQSFDVCLELKIRWDKVFIILKDFPSTQYVKFSNWNIYIYTHTHIHKG